MRQESRHELELHGLPLLAAGAGRQIQRHHAETGKIRAYITPLGIELGNAQTGGDLLRLFAAVTSHAAIALLFRVMEVTMIAGRSEHLHCHVRRLRLEFLQTDNVGVLPREPFKKSLAGGGADPVQVDRDDAHESFQRWKASHYNDCHCLNLRRLPCSISGRISSALRCSKKYCVLANFKPRQDV